MPRTPPPKAKRRPTNISYAPRAPSAPKIHPFQGAIGLSGHTTTFPAAQHSYSAAPSQASAATNPGAATAAPAPDIRDPEYWLNLANIKQYYGTAQATLQAESTQDELARDRALGILGLKGPTDKFKSGNYDAGGVQNQGTYYSDIRKTEEGANKAGLFYSGILGRDKGDILTSYEQRRGGLVEEEKGRQDLRDISGRDLLAQYGPGGIQERTALETARQRQLERDANNPGLGALTGSLVPTNAAGNPVKGAGPTLPVSQPQVGGYSGVNGTWDPRGFWVIMSGGKKIHQYPDGRRVVVK